MRKGAKMRGFKPKSPDRRFLPVREHHRLNVIQGIWFGKPIGQYLKLAMLTVLIVWATNACGSRQDTEVFTNALGMKFVLIPAGSFMMGSPISEKTVGRGEVPQHRVEISKPFFLQTREVTQSQWKAVMGTEPWKGKKEVKANCPSCPAVYISYLDIQEFIKRLNQKEETARYRLPTEAEWEYACRAGSETAYSFGDDPKQLDKYAWHAGNAYAKGEAYAHAVERKRPNAWGLYDMHGNVWEWCSDWYGEEYYLHSPARDPKGPPSSKFGRVLRGGSFSFYPPALRSATRIPGGQSNRFLRDAGFRLVAEPQGRNASP